MINFPSYKSLFLSCVFIFFYCNVNAADSSNPKLVIQVTTNDPKTQNIALNNAVNVQKIYGLDDVIIEIVAYGSGLELLTKEGKLANRIETLATQNITFSACLKSIEGFEKKTGKAPTLISGVQKVNSGVDRVLQLQENGYISLYFWH